jgi:hypothetical protein
LPVTKIKITFEAVSVVNDADMWGDATWQFQATADGASVGNPKADFIVSDGKAVVLAQPDWSTVVDVSAKKKGDSVKVIFSGKDTDTFVWDHDLGSVNAEFKYPFTEEKRILLRSPVKKGWFFLPDHQYYVLAVSMKIADMKATAALTGPNSIQVSRQNDGSSTFSTVSGAPVTPRVEVCPIIPVPINGKTMLPGRPPQPAGVEMGLDTDNIDPVSLSTTTSLNSLFNPSVIPILSEDDSDLDNKIARLAVTYTQPFNLDTSFLTWHVVSGPAKFIGGNSGPIVKVLGTGNAADTMAEFEVRWDGPKGPVLAKYRAWVGKVGKIPYRLNLLDGSTAASKASTVLSPTQVDKHIQAAKIIWWQVGLLFVPDSTAATYDGATASGTAGVYNVTVANNNHTVKVNMNAKPAATRYNFRPGVINIAYVRSTLQRRAVASDVQGTAGATVTLGGTPSSSWVKPSGIPTDAAAAPVKMKGMPSSDRLAHPGPGDAAFITARQAADSTFTSASMKQLYACMLPTDWWSPDDPTYSGVNLAHELGHVLGLRHRGNGETDHPPLSDDGVNSPDNKKKPRGHPWFENVMTYGYSDNSTLPMSLDLDLIQAMVVRQHPAISYT